MDDIIEMDETEYKKCLKHFEASSDESDFSDFEEIRENFRPPPPIQIDSRIHKIIKIGPKNDTCGGSSGVRIAQDNPMQEADAENVPPVRSESQPKRLSKNQRRRRKKKREKRKLWRNRQKIHNNKININGDENGDFNEIKSETVLSTNPIVATDKDVVESILLDKNDLTNNSDDNVDDEIESVITKGAKKLNNEEEQKTQLQTPKVNYVNQFNEVFNSLNSLLTTVPFDTANIDRTIDEYFRLFPLLGIRPLPCLYSMADLMKSTTKRNQESIERMENTKIQREVKLPETVFFAEAKVFDDLNRLMVSSTEAMLAYMKEEVAKNSPGLSVSEDGDKVLKVADVPGERQFPYDGYLHDNGDSWYNFRELYLDCDILTAVRGTNSYRTPQPCLVVPYCTSSLRSLFDFDNRLEFSPNFQRFRLNHEIINENNIECYSTNSSVEDLDLEVVSQDDTPCVKSGSSFSENVEVEDLNANEEEFVVQRTESQNEDVGKISAVDYPLEWFREYCNKETALSDIIFFLIFKNVLGLFLLYCSDIVCLMLIFLYLCIYFVIKF